MRKNILVVLLMFLTIFTACAHGRKTVKKKKPVSKNMPSSLHAITSLTFRRGACFGRCPEYSITIKSDGHAEYNGYRNATPLGIYQKNIGAKAAQSLLKEFMDYRVDTCKSLYTSRIADMPSEHYVFIISGNEKKVNNAQFGPLYFTVLGKSVDALGIPDASWKKMSDQAGD